MFPNQHWAWVLTLLCAYLLGAFNTSITVGKIFYNQDIRKVGSGNAGATNTLRAFGIKNAILVALGDALKTILAMLLAWLLIGNANMLFAGCMAVFGHIFPIYYGFRGGKGVMSAATMIAVFDWRIFVVVLIVFAATVAITRWVSLASILCAASFPLATFLRYLLSNYYFYAALAIALLVILKHSANIKRIIAKTEHKLGEKKDSPKAV